LGSDCPFFVRSEAQVATGRGEILQPVDVPLDGYYLKLINPGIHVGTARAYSGVVLNENPPLINEIVTQSPDTWRGKLFNSFEEHIFRVHPELNRIKESLYTEGAVYAAMSGSGSTLFGIFNEQPELTYSNYYEKIVKFNP
jgi:4-diphosphocytidyl-2-C-methyl-D-erythritol kinase